MVRIVPSRSSSSEVIGLRLVECLVYFGTPIHDFADEDRVDGYKLMAIRLTVQG